MRLKDRVAIVTGGASGFGEGIVRRFVEEGAKVAIVDLNNEAAGRLAKELGQLPVTADVSDRASVEAMTQAVRDRFGRIDILVNNAGVGHKPQPLDQLGEDAFDRIFKVNAKSVYLTAQAIVPIMKAQGSGAILNVAGGVRLLRGAALEQRPLPYVEAARTLGVPRWRIMYLHIWRNISPIVFANAALDFALALVALSSLSYLGLGTEPGVPEWGRMLSENQSLLFQNPAGVLAPALAIVFFATAVTIIGDWIYDRFSYGGRTGR